MMTVPAACFAPPSGAEARSLIALGASDLTFAGLLQAAVRARYLVAACSPCGPEAAQGLAAAEQAACLALAARPAIDRRELRAKEAVLHPFAEAGGRAGAMVRAALAQDAGRLGMAGTPAGGEAGPGPARRKQAAGAVKHAGR